MRALKVIGIAFLVCVVLALTLYATVPRFRTWANGIFHDVQKADDASRYSTRKQVEDTARAMIASYEADVFTYEQYRDSQSDEQRSWAEQAAMRANRTASTYNNYILQNSYVWEDNIPDDMRHELEPLEAR